MHTRVAMLLVTAVLAVSAPLDAAPSGAPEATVTAASLDGSITTYTDCEGDVTTSTNAAALAVIRTGSTTQPLTVDVSYGGTLTPGTDYPPQPDPVTIDAGTDRAILFVDATEVGTVSLTVEAGTGYAPGDPATTTAEVDGLAFPSECPAPERQTIAVGEAPTDIDVYGRFGSELAATVVEVSGTVPPGLSFDGDGSFSGTASEVGTFSFTARYCLGEFCALVLPVTIEVVPLDHALPGPVDPSSGATPATPARPLAGQAGFTG